jgi:hypothetical protein
MAKGSYNYLIGGTASSNRIENRQLVGDPQGQQVYIDRPIGLADQIKDARLFNQPEASNKERLETNAQMNKWQRPMSSLDSDPFQFSSLVYPRDITNNHENGHYMLFYVNVQNKTKYGYDGYDAKGKSIRIGDKVIEDKSGGRGNFDVVAADDPSYTQGINNIAAGGKGNIDLSDGVDLRRGRKPKQGMASYRPTTSRITDSVAIYLPPNIKNTTGAQYTGAAMGAMGLAAAGGGKFLDAMTRGDYTSAASMLTGTGSQIIAAGLQKAISAGVDLFFDAGEASSSDLYNKAFGNANNPYMEVFFGGMELRTFSYNFTFAPRNADERDDVQKIIKLFRFHMAPELQGENMRYLTLPSTFDIHYMYQHTHDRAKENNFYNKIATCVLQNVDVDYAANGVKSFADGSPTQITMNLSFMETELMTKEMIDRGF